MYGVGFQSSEIPTVKLYKIFIDDIGPLPLCKTGNQYISTFVDAFSKCTLWIPTHNNKAQTTVNTLTKIVFTYFGFPKCLVSDNVPSFNSSLIAQMPLDYGIKHICTSPYYRKSPHAEKVNKNLKIAFRIFHTYNQTNWVQFIGWFQLAFNTATYVSSGNSPANLFLRHHIPAPLQLVWNLDQFVPHSTHVANHIVWSEPCKSYTKHMLLGV